MDSAEFSSKIRQIRFNLLSLTSKNFLLIDLNKPLIPNPQKMDYQPKFYELPPEITIQSWNVEDKARIQYHILENISYKHQFTVDFHPSDSDSPIASNSKLDSDNLSILDFSQYLSMCQENFLLEPDQSVSDATIQRIFQSYFLQISEDSLILQAISDQGLFYGLTTLSQLIHKNQNRWVMQQVTIFDFPHFLIRGATDQLCHGQVPSIEMLKTSIRFLARYKNNVFGLNLEDIMRFDRWPYLSTSRGSLSTQEIQEIYEFAQKYFLDLFPGFQALGHLENFLYHSDFRELAEFPGSNCLNLVNSNTKLVLKEWYAEICEKFQSKYVHIEMDEAYDFGLFASNQYVKENGRDKVLLEHIQWVSKILHDSQGKKIFMYHDSILSWSPKIFNQLPKNIMIIYWNYNNVLAKRQIKKIAKSQKFFIVSPSIANWSRPFPDLLKSQKNILNMALLGEKYGAKGFLNSMWGDFGNENLRINNYYGLGIGSDCAWNPSSYNESNFQQAFIKDWFGMHNPHLLWDTVRNLSKINHGAIFQTQFFEQLWDHPLNLKGPKYPKKWAKQDLKLIEYVQEMLNTTRIYVKKNQHFMDFLQYSIDLAKFNAQKVLLTHKILPIWKKKQIIPHIYLKDLKVLKSKNQELWKIYSSLWFSIAKPHGLERIERNYHFLDQTFIELINACQHQYCLRDPLLISEWITHPEKNIMQKPLFFKKRFSLSMDDIINIKFARIQCIANTYLKISINGQYIGEVISRFFLSPVIYDNAVKIFDFSPFLQPNSNEILIEAWNYSYSPIAINLYGEIVHKAGKKLVIKSDTTWSVTDEDPSVNPTWQVVKSKGAAPYFNGLIGHVDLSTNSPSWISHSTFGKQGYLESMLFMQTKSIRITRFLSKFYK